MSQNAVRDHFSVRYCNTKMIDFVAEFKRRFMSTPQAKIQLASYASVILVTFLMALVTRSAQGIALSIIATGSMFFATYANNCYVVGSCHGLSWLSTSLTVLWTALFFLERVLQALRKI